MTAKIPTLRDFPVRVKVNSNIKSFQIPHGSDQQFLELVGLVSRSLLAQAGETRASKKAIKADYFAALAVAHAFGPELTPGSEQYRRLQSKKATCTHDKTRIRTQSYNEQGRMSGPVSWREEVCCKCGKVVATEETKTATAWRKTAD